MNLHILIINPVIRVFLVTLFLRNYTTNFDETLHTLQGHANTGLGNFHENPLTNKKVACRSRGMQRVWLNTTINKKPITL